MKRLAVITSHPIQYNAPLFALLNQRGQVRIKVFYTWGDEVLKKKFDPGFGKAIDWDIPLLNGYEYKFLQNVSRDPGSHHFNGIDNPAILQEVGDWKPDAVLVYGWAFKSHLRVIRAFHKRIPVMFRGDSTSLQQLPFFKKMLRTIFLRWIYSHIDLALYVGTHNKAYFKELGLKESQLLFAPHAIDNERFQTETEAGRQEVARWKDDLGIPATDLVLLYAGKLDPNKNVGMLLDAFSVQPRPGVHLVVAGNGVTEKQLKVTYGKSAGVHFIPFQNQSRMPLLYKMADVFVLPSLSETWGLAINEAMACSCALLVSDSCGAAIDLVREGANGYTFRKADRQDLLEKLNRLLSERAAIKGMGTHSAALIESWNFTATAQKIEQYLNRTPEEVIGKSVV